MKGRSKIESVSIQPDLLEQVRSDKIPDSYNLCYSLVKKPVYWKPTEISFQKSDTESFLEDDNK
jgi:hypothetical protein